jgi:cytochrome c peroxidase
MRGRGGALGVGLTLTLLMAFGWTEPTSQLEQWKASYRRPSLPAPEPADNQSNPERVQLGKKLFFDPRLSGNGQLSCATCHNPGLSWGDGLPVAIGMGGKKLARRTPTLLNLAWGQEFFWDGRASSLEEQALMPIFNAEEMGQTQQLMLRYVSESYKPAIQAAYPGEPVSPKTVGKALACFERTIISARSPFDRWIEGDQDALSQGAQRGFVLFNSKANCSTCHSGWRLTDDAFYDIGVPGQDPGRGKIYPGLDTVEYAFKTPTLRDVARRYPYLHDGSEKTLLDVVNLYDAGGRVKRRSLSDQIRPLALSEQEKSDLVEFMGSLTAPESDFSVPALPRTSY